MPSPKMNSVKLSFLIFFGFFALSTGFVQELFIHENPSSGKNFCSFNSAVSRSNSTDICKYIQLSSSNRICARGLWLVFPEENFGGSYAYFGSWNSPDLICRQSSFPYKSFRHVGSGETEENLISLYTGKNLWGGREIAVKRSAYGGLTIPPQIQHFGMTGREKWLFFEGPNFNGSSTCFGNSAETIVQGYTTAFHLGLRTIGSIFKGCQFSNLKGTPLERENELIVEKITPTD